MTGNVFGLHDGLTWIGSYDHALQSRHALLTAAEYIDRARAKCLIALESLSSACGGCDGRCGPEQWAQQRKCCPDCECDTFSAQRHNLQSALASLSGADLTRVAVALDVDWQEGGSLTTNNLVDASTVAGTVAATTLGLLLELATAFGLFSSARENIAAAANAVIIANTFAMRASFFALAALSRSEVKL